MTMLRLVGALTLACMLATTAITAKETAPSPLMEALAFVPEASDPTSLQFVDWAQLKDLHGGAGISSTSPLAERQRLMLDIVRAEAAPMDLGIDRLATWPDAWGWDSTDLDWEARVFGEIAVLRFGEHWDVQPFRDALSGFGYEAHGFEGGVAYRPDPDAEVPSQLRFANMHGLDIHGREITEPTVWVAISDDGRTVVLGRADGVGRSLRAGLKADPARVEASGFGRAAAALGRPVTASVLDGRSACSERMNEWLMGEALEVAASVAPLHRYEALAAGYTRADASALPDGRYVFAYPRSQQARDDLAGRRTLVEEGYPFNDSTSRYEDVAFSLVDARVAGSRLILDVAPVGGAPVHVLRHVRTSPILFATCGLVPESSSA